MKDQFKALPEVQPRNLTGRVVIVTGANTGLGLEAARHFAVMKPEKLILAVRTLDKGEEAKQSILTSAPTADIEVWKLDMASFASVKSFAARAKKDLPRLDLLLLNAGIAPDNWKVSPDGYEST